MKAISDMIISMIHTSHCKRDTFIHVNGDINTCLRIHGKSLSNIEPSDLPQHPGRFIYLQSKMD